MCVYIEFLVIRNAVNIRAYLVIPVTSIGAVPDLINYVDSANLQPRQSQYFYVL